MPLFKTPDGPKTQSVASQRRPSSFDIVATHKQLELWELRIINGQDARYPHPAHAVIAARENQECELTKAEKARAGRYREVKIKEKRPSFWTPRPWDKGVMNEAQSQALAAKIERASEAKAVTQGRKRSGNHKGRSARLRMKERAVVELDPIYYGTDQTDDETEWSDF
jgi:hypothetical protein